MSAMFQLSKVDIFMHGNTGVAGKWGSHFWKDCQPMGSSVALEFGGESKSGSEYKNDGGSEKDSIGGRPQDREELEGDYEDKEDGKILKKKLLDSSSLGQISAPDSMNLAVINFQPYLSLITGR